jgi:hypothetical protein
MYILCTVYPSGIRCHLLVHSTKSVQQSAAPPISTNLVRPCCMFCDEADLGTVFDLFYVVLHWLPCHLILALVNCIQGRTREKVKNDGTNWSVSLVCLRPVRTMHHSAGRSSNELLSSVTFYFCDGCRFYPVSLDLRFSCNFLFGDINWPWRLRVYGMRHCVIW